METIRWLLTILSLVGVALILYMIYAGSKDDQPKESERRLIKAQKALRAGKITKEQYRDIYERESQKHRDEMKARGL